MHENERQSQSAATADTVCVVINDFFTSVREWLKQSARIEEVWKMGENCMGTENCLIDEEHPNRTFMEISTYDPMSGNLVTSTIVGLNTSYERDYNSTAAPNDASQTSIGVLIAVFLCTLLIFIVIFGNTLVILSVLTTRRLRTVSNNLTQVCCVEPK